MRIGKKLVFAAMIALVLLPCRSGFAAADDDKDRVLRQLDEAAKNFHSTSADFEFDTVETDPVPDKDVQKGTVYYERKGNAFQMAAHIRELNGKISYKVYTFASGVFKLYEKLTN